MANESTLAELDAMVLASIRINNNKEITPPIDSAIRYAQNKSFPNKKDGGLVMQALFGYSVELTPTDDKHFTPKKFVDEKISDGSYSAGWDGVTDVAPSKNAVYDAIENIDLTPLWSKDGNTLSARGKFGSTSGAYGWDDYINNVVVRGISNTGQSYYGTNAAAASTDNTWKGSGNTGGSWVAKYFNVDDALTASIDNNGLISSLAGYGTTANVDMPFYINGTNRVNIKRTSSFGNYTSLELISSADTGSDSQTSLVFLKPSGSAGILSGYSLSSDLAFFAGDTGVGTLKLLIQNKGFTFQADMYDSSNINKFIKVDGRQLVNQSGNDVIDFVSSPYIKSGYNFGVGANDSGGGVGVFSLYNAPTDASTNPTVGVVLQSKSGRAKVMEVDGSLSFLVKALSSTKTTAGAPYTNDGYVEMIIDGVTVKVMTTA